MDILNDMLVGVGRTVKDYLQYGENKHNRPLPNGHRVFVHETRRVALQAAMAMAEEDDIVVSCTVTLIYLTKVLVNNNPFFILFRLHFLSNMFIDYLLY